MVSSSYSCLTLPSDIPIRLVDVRVCLLSGFRRLPASFLTVSAGYDYDWFMSSTLISSLQRPSVLYPFASAFSGRPTPKNSVDVGVLRTVPVVIVDI